MLLMIWYTTRIAFNILIGAATSFLYMQRRALMTALYTLYHTVDKQISSRFRYIIGVMRFGGGYKKRARSVCIRVDDRIIYHFYLLP